MARGKLSQGTHRASQIRVGIVLIVGLVALAYGTFQVGRLFDVFAKRYVIYATVEHSGGLMSGAAVTLAGQRIGQVDEVRFIPVEDRLGDTNIRIRLAVNRDVQEQIRRDSRASLRTQGLLGDRYVDISPGSPEFAVLQAGDTIATEPALDYEQVLETAAATLDDVQAIMADLKTTTGRIAGGEGTIGALLADDRLYERMVAGTDELGRLLHTLNTSDGTLARLIHDPAMYDQADAALSRLDSLGAMVMAGQGTLGRLVADDALYDELLGAAGRVDTALAGIETFVQDMVTADGTLARLLENPALYDEILKAVVDLQTLIRAIRDNPREFRPEVRVRVF